MQAKKSIYEIAQIAGVSAATVSRALHNPTMVKKETLERVLAVVKETNFVSNAQARSFRQQTTRTVVLLVRDISNPFYLEIFKGVEEAASDAGYKVLMADARNDEARVKSYIDLVRQRQADGVIVMLGSLPLNTVDGLDRSTPIVVASEALPDVDLPTVRIDNVAAAREAVHYLVAQGHRHIAHIGGMFPDYLGQERRKGYELALEDAGIVVDPELIVAGDFSITAGRDAACRLLDRGAHFTAIFASSDQMAIGAIGALRQHGLSVPADVSVIGFDDIILAEAFEPPLTTVRQPRLEMGRKAMQLMIGRLERQEVASVHEFKTRLVVRSSVAAPPASIEKRKLGHIEEKQS